MQATEFKVLLEDKREELTRRVNAIHGDFAKGRSADFAEQATESENDDVLKNLEFEANSEIRQINEALQRIKDGEFGYCERCGKDINVERLKILPYTQFCRDCAD